MMPLANGVNGRDTNGRFAAGNAGGPGNPNNKRTAAYRNAILDAVSEDDIRDVILAVLTKAKEGDLAACKEILDRTVGRPKSVEPDESATNHTQIWFTPPETPTSPEQRRENLLRVLDAELRRRGMEVPANRGRLEEK